MKRLFFLGATSLLLNSCEPWSIGDVAWELDDRLFLCNSITATRSELSWKGSCADNGYMDTLWQVFPTWKKQWPAPSIGCTLTLHNYRREIPCAPETLIWLRDGAVATRQGKNHPLFDWLLAREFEDIEYQLFQGICNQDSALAQWWKDPPAMIDTCRLHQMLSTCLRPGILPDPWLPWSMKQHQEEAVRAVSQERISRTQFLTWTQRTLGVAPLDSILLSLGHSDTSKALRIGACPASLQSPATAPFFMARHEASRAECGLGSTTLDSALPASALSWEAAQNCAYRQQARLPTLAEWKCALGIWKDTLPWPWTTTTGQAGSPSLLEWLPDLQANRGILPSDSLSCFPAGLHALLGNVAEWIQDSSWAGNHFLVGGSYLSTASILRNPVNLEEIFSEGIPEDAGLRFIWDSRP